MSRPQTLLDITNLCPPGLCRFLARKKHGLWPMSYDDIALRAGLARSTVIRLSHLPAWGNTPLLTIVKFAEGCGVNHLSLKRHTQFIKRHKKAYLEHATPAQRKMLFRLVKTISGDGRHNGAPDTQLSDASPVVTGGRPSSSNADHR